MLRPFWAAHCRSAFGSPPLPTRLLRKASFPPLPLLETPVPKPKAVPCLRIFQSSEGQQCWVLGSSRKNVLFPDETGIRTPRQPCWRLESHAITLNHFTSFCFSSCPLRGSQQCKVGVWHFSSLSTFLFLLSGPSLLLATVSNSEKLFCFPREAKAMQQALGTPPPCDLVLHVWKTQSLSFPEASWLSRNQQESKRETWPGGRGEGYSSSLARPMDTPPWPRTESACSYQVAQILTLVPGLPANGAQREEWKVRFL